GHLDAIINMAGIFAMHAKMGISSGTYLLTQSRVVLKYFGLLFFPYSQNLDHDLPWSAGLFDGVTLPSLLVVILLIAAAFRSARRFPLISFGILWFFLTLSVSSSIIPQKDAVMEHRLYLPSVGFFIAFLAAAYGLIKHSRWFVVCAAGVVLSLSFLTYQRNALWTDEVKFWEDVVRKSPGKARPYTNLGLVYRKHGEYSKAIAAYEKALSLRPPSGEPLSRIYTNLGAVYGVMRRYPAEIALYLKAIAADPKNYQAYSNLGYAYALVGDYRNAVKYGEAAVKMAPRFDEAWNNLGVTHARMEHYQEAVYAFQGALRINPYYKEAASNLSLAREKLGQS
ncbi:MAG: tetratricopeptide repeat protein, partial [Clostridia bacterium]|nr:tetratricopeptide repeat protein [Clostridia bacterium]